MSNLESLMLQHIHNFVKHVSNRASFIDLMPACRALESDIIAHFSFGKQLNAVEGWASANSLEMISRNDEKATWFPLITNFPRLYQTLESTAALLHRLGGLHIPYFRALKEYDNWTAEACRQVMDDDIDSSLYPNLIRVLVSSALPPDTALAEAKENLGPGTDTTSGSLAHILFALAQNPVFQESLFDDLSRIDFSTNMSALEGIPRLAACVKEGIRWAGTAAAMLPRVAHKGGIDIQGKFIPEATVLTSSPIWYLRDETAFPKPHLFNPYRWLSDDASSLKQDNTGDQYYIPFSKGAHVCMGMHFAYYELFMSLSKLIQSFRLHSHGKSAFNDFGSNLDWNLVSLPPRREWVAAVLTDKLEVAFTPRKDSS